jgi:hypothetical protein
LSFGSSVDGHRVLTGPPDPRQHPFGSGQCPYPASCAGRPAEALAISPGFLLPFGCRPWLFGSSFARWGVRPSLRSAYRRECLRTPSGLPRSTRARYDRGGCPLHSGTAMLSRLAKNPQPAPAASQRPVLHPAGTSHLRSQRSRSIIRGSVAFTRPVFPLPVVCGWNAGPWAFPPSSAPSRYRQRTSGWRLALSTGQEYAADVSRRASDQRIHSSRAASCRTSFFFVSTLITGSPPAWWALACSLM